MSDYGCVQCHSNEFVRVEAIALNASGIVEATLDRGIMKCANCGSRYEIIEGGAPAPMQLRPVAASVTLTETAVPRRSTSLRTSRTASDRGIDDVHATDH